MIWREQEVTDFKLSVLLKCFGKFLLGMDLKDNENDARNCVTVSVFNRNSCVTVFN